MKISEAIAKFADLLAAQGDINLVFHPWEESDIIQLCEDRNLKKPSKTEIKKIMFLMEHEHDANVGISWDVIETWIDYVRDGYAYNLEI
jgi:hypothetical protein